ncbi:undecaprenyl-phosphate alpha-N-acetylglucosaminyl 1-phosphate transferase, partial [Pectobacterium parmentieri]|nr:undecaprenyl-phosphate alpha-N-acetylglucosaminyl 1-phosphate transferase [Pectobacterium parmentieri]
AGLSSRQSSLAIVLAALFFAAVGIIGELSGVMEPITLSAFLVIFVGYFWSITRIWRLLTWFRRSSGRHV